MDQQQITGGCGCGAVRFTVEGPPVRAGLCHCLTCRKAHAAAFNAFVVYRRSQVALAGETQSWLSSADYRRIFCPRCGSPVAGSYVDAKDEADEIELFLGSFDAPGLVAPGYESWTIRREPWLRPLDVAQNERDPAFVRPARPA